MKHKEKKKSEPKNGKPKETPSQRGTLRIPHSLKDRETSQFLYTKCVIFLVIID